VPAAAVILLAAPGGSSAESRYSLRGNGEASLAVRADARALGGAETASGVPSVTGNPANLALADRTLFYGTYETEWVRTEEAGEGGTRIRKDYAGLVPNLCLVFPLPGNMSLGTGLVVDRRQGGRIEADATTPDGQAYRQIYDAKGNVLLFPALLARRFGRVHAGFGLDVILRNSEIRWMNDFPDDSGFDDSDDLDKVSMWGVAWKLGARVPVGSRAAVGAWYSLPSNLNGSRRLENDDPFDSSDDLKIDAKGEMATEWSLGVAAKPIPSVRILADWVHEGWESAEPPAPGDRLADVDRFAFGAEWSRGGGAWPLRTGYRTERLHVLDGAGQRVREHALTVGSGFGVAGGRGVIDWYFEHAWRGERDRTEFEERLFRFGVSLTGVEKWSRRRRPEEDEEW
jgi:hypothetical protein